MGFWYSLLYKLPEDVRALGMPKGIRNGRFTTERGSVLEFVPEEKQGPFRSWCRRADNMFPLLFFGLMLPFIIVFWSLAKLTGVEQHPDSWQDIAGGMIGCVGFIVILIVTIAKWKSGTKQNALKIRETLRLRGDSLANPDDGWIYTFQDFRAIQENYKDRRLYDIGLTSVSPGWLSIEADTFRARLHAEDIDFGSGVAVGLQDLLFGCIVMRVRFGEIEWSVQIMEPRGKKLLKRIQERLHSRTDGRAK